MKQKKNTLPVWVTIAESIVAYYGAYFLLTLATTSFALEAFDSPLAFALLMVFAIAAGVTYFLTKRAHQYRMTRGHGAALLGSVLLFMWIYLGLMTEGVLVPYDIVPVDERPEGTALRAVNDFFEVGIGKNLLFYVYVLIHGVVLWMNKQRWVRVAQAMVYGTGMLILLLVVLAILIPVGSTAENHTAMLGMSHIGVFAIYGIVMYRTLKKT